MNLKQYLRLAACACLVVLAGCATRPINPPVKSFDSPPKYLIEQSGQSVEQSRNLVILAFSGGGTRAAAFSYGVLETLRRTEVEKAGGGKIRLLDQVDTITGVSGGSFTALAYRLYGEQLFDEYEKRFLKYNVQGELIGRTLNPLNWGALSSTGWGRSELAADLYDDLLFNGATFADLDRKPGPYIAVSSTDITTGARVVFVPHNFDVMCTDLGSFRVARAAAASSAVPVVLSPLTINNYGGTCHFSNPPWMKMFVDKQNAPRPAARVLKRIEEFKDLTNGKDPYLHLVDGGISDNLGLRGVLDTLNLFEAMHQAGQPTVLDHVDRVVVFVVNSLSIPDTDWSKSEDAPGTIQVMIKAAGVPIDRYSGEQIEQLKDIEARWQLTREVRQTLGPIAGKSSMLDYAQKAPKAQLYVVNVSFSEMKDKTEQNFLNQLPTSFVLQDGDVDRLRAAASQIILDSPEFQRLLKDVKAKVIESPAKTEN